MSPTIVLAPEASKDAASCKEMVGQFGDVFRADSETMDGTKHMLVTYYDVRSASAAVKNLNGKAALVPVSTFFDWAVKLSLADFVNQHLLQRLHCFGEVSYIRAFNGSVVIGFFDLRAATNLLTSLEGKGKPCYVPSVSQSVNTEHESDRATTNGPMNEAHWMHAVARAAPLPDALPLPMFIPRVKAQTEDLQPQTPEKGSGPTQISKEEYALFDIDPAKIESGEDMRTTVMIRQLTGNHKRDDLLRFLQKCNLQSQYNLLYIPCKSDRKVHASFAFVNFFSPKDVLTLWKAVMTQPWHSQLSEKGIKKFAVSYAKVQG